MSFRKTRGEIMTSSNADRINSLLDGELDSVNETVLFNDLASDSDLRTEFLTQLAIRQAVQQDRALLIPPVTLTSSVFSGIGFAAPIAGAAAGAAGGSMLGTWLMKLLIPVTSAAAAAGITYGVMTFNSPKPPGSQTMSVQPAAATQTPVTPSPLGRMPTQTGASVPTNSATLNRALERNSRLQREVDRLRAELAEFHSAAQTNAPLEATPIEEQPITDVVQTNEISYINLTRTVTFERDAKPRAFSAIPAPFANLEYEEYPSFSLQMRGIASSPLMSLNVPAQTSLMENATIGLMYQLTPRSTVGVEVGSESYAMSFEGNRNGQLIRYEQQPVATWAGVTYRHAFSPIGKSDFSPFVQGLAGGTQYGPLGRLTTGIAYSPSGPLSFILGVEGTTMAYTYQNQWFTSSKIGLTYGVAIRF